jgi:HlyD family secretion protein
LESEEPKSVFFIPPTDGKKVRPGMKVHISLPMFPPEEYGFMLAVVSDVSNFPASVQSMMNLLENSSLVQMFSQDGPPIKVTAQLLKDPTTYSGYAWTSSEGPRSYISAGTVCSSGIVVREQAPISMVFPFIKRKLGI